MKQFKVVGLLLMGVLFLWGCTGEKQTKRTQMQTREIFLISGSYPEDVCMGTTLTSALQTQMGLTNIMTSATNDSVNCAYFSRTSTSCVRFSFTKAYEKSCVIAADRDITKQQQQINAKAIANMMIELLKK